MWYTFVYQLQNDGRWLPDIGLWKTLTGAKKAAAKKKAFMEEENVVCEIKMMSLEKGVLKEI